MGRYASLLLAPTETFNLWQSFFLPFGQNFIYCIFSGHFLAIFTNSINHIDYFLYPQSWDIGMPTKQKPKTNYVKIQIKKGLH